MYPRLTHQRLLKPLGLSRHARPWSFFSLAHRPAYPWSSLSRRTRFCAVPLIHVRFSIPISARIVITTAVVLLVGLKLAVLFDVFLHCRRSLICSCKFGVAFTASPLAVEFALEFNNPSSA